MKENLLSDPVFTPLLSMVAAESPMHVKPDMTSVVMALSTKTARAVTIASLAVWVESLDSREAESDASLEASEAEREDSRVDNDEDLAASLLDSAAWKEE